jgi:hypothetical protein
MNHRRGAAIGLPLLAAILFVAPCRAQDDSSETPGKDVGSYHVQQTVDFGYRLNEVSGNQDTYDTFINLGSGVRLFDYTFDMRSLDHQGFLFDDLHFSNFGYGGDPNDVSRLHVDKNKWYDFHLLFRRDKNFWDYNLFANPFNPAAPAPTGSATSGCILSGPSTANPGIPGYCSTPAIGFANSAHALDLTRRMQDYDLTLLPQSRVRFRLGFSHYRNQGPGFLTGDIGVNIADFPESYSYTTNAYRAGVDFRLLPRTTISYDQFLNYFKQDNSALATPSAAPQDFGYQVANGTPVDLGIVWETQTPAEIWPCAAPITNPTTTPPTANPLCTGYTYYSQDANARNTMPTERVRFQSNYFEKLQTDASFGYSTSKNLIPNFNETEIGWSALTFSPGGTTAGPADARRFSADGAGSAVYSITSKFRVEDFFRYNSWRIPGAWNSVLGTFFNTTQGIGLGAPVGDFAAANCNLANSYSGPACPNHTATSAADVADAFNWNFLKQDMKSNTFELDYDFTRRLNAFIGYLYDHRQIVSSAVSYTTGDIYFPGGATATAANDYFAARGNCTLVSGALPAGCTLNADGSITFIPASPATPPVYQPLTIGESALLFGMRARPIDSLTLTGDLAWGYNDTGLTRIDPRHVQSYKLHATYNPKPWATVDGAVQIHDNQDNVASVVNYERDRTYSVTTMLAPNSHFAISFGYNYWFVYTQAEICFNYSIVYANPAPPPVNLPVSTSPPGVAAGASGLGALSTYASTDHFAHAEVMWKPSNRVTVALGYAGSFVRGNSTFLDPLAPSGTLDYNYQSPYGSIEFALYRGFSYKLAWNYYGFDQQGNTSPFGLAPIPLQNFNGNNFTSSFRYAF